MHSEQKKMTKAGNEVRKSKTQAAMTQTNW